MPTLKERPVGERPRREREERGKYFVQAVVKAFDILELVGQSAEPLSLAQITRNLRQSKSSAFRILCTLEQKGLVTRKLGDLYEATHSLGSTIPNQLLGKLLQAAEPVMRDLSREFRESVSLALLFENHIGVVAVVDSPQKIRMGNVVGGIIPPHASSLGKCITANQSDAILDHLLRTYGICAFTAHTITDEAQLDEEFCRVREQGYAIDREESTLDGCCLAAPMFTSTDRVTSAISVSFLKNRLRDEQAVIRAVCAAAKTISDQLKTS